MIEHLRKAPAEPVSVDRIAEMADVARSTVYAIFGSRAGLFDAVAADVLERDAYERLLEAKPSPTRASTCASGSSHGTEMLASRPRHRARPLLHGTAGPSGVGAAVRRREEIARARNGAPCRPAARSRICCRPGVSVADAEHILWVLTSFESFDLLHTGRGLSQPPRPPACLAERPNARCLK